MPDTEATLASVRKAITTSYHTARQYDQFADTSVTAFHRGGTVDYSNAEQKNNGEYVIKNRSLSCAMFHSETQALGLATVELPVTMRALVDQILAMCRMFGTPVQAVIVALHVRGVSHPNAVCGGACKPALVILLDRINQQLVADYHPRKPALRDEQIWLRRSEQYRATMDVQGLQAFQGSERVPSPKPHRRSPATARSPSTRLSQRRAIRTAKSAVRARFAEWVVEDGPHPDQNSAPTLCATKSVNLPPQRCRSHPFSVSCSRIHRYPVREGCRHCG